MNLTIKHITENSDLIYIATQTGLGALAPKDLNLERVVMLLGEPGDDVFAHYFNSAWFPMTRGGSLEGNLHVVEQKVKQLPEDQLNNFVLVVTSHWRSIEDNFKWPLAYLFKDAVEQEQRLNEQS